MSDWYLVHSKPASEVTAEENLQRQDYEVYLPRLTRTVRRRGRRYERIVPLFPRYLFVRVNRLTQSLGPVLSTRGVSDVVRFGQQYATVPSAMLELLRHRADRESGLHRLQEPGLPKPGTVVRIAEGPFNGLDGIFEREAGADRVVILIDLLGSQTKVQVPVNAMFQYTA